MPREVQVQDLDPTLTRQHRGARSHCAGTSAESQVASLYQRHGFVLDRVRWRGKAGEIDLIFRDGPGLVFVEVKASRTFDRAAQSLRPRQINRILAAAEEYVATEHLGSLTPMRFDVALVDRQGHIRILEKAIGPA